MDRAEATGLTVALVGHAALLAALSLGLATVTVIPPPSQPVEVSLVDEVDIANAAPQASPEPAAAAVAPEAGPIEEPAPQPTVEPVPLPPEPQPVPPPPAPRQAQKPAPQKPAPQKPQPQKPAAQKPAPPRPAPAAAGKGAQPRAPRLGADFLKNLGSDPASRSAAPPAATVSAEARASIDAAILRALAPCQRQSLPVPEARQIHVQVEVVLDKSGDLASARVLKVSNDDPDLKIYEQRMRDLALSVVQQCTPIRGLPAELYSVPRGWRRFNYTFPRT
jgi:outer membrane biosynthesis protein TonB